MAVQRVHHLLGSLVEFFVRPQAFRLQKGGPDIRGHDDDCVLEVHGAAFAVRQAAVVHDLQEDVEDVGMRLLNFVEQHYGVRPPPDLLGELAAFFVSHVSGRSADEPRDRMLLHVFRHINADHGAFVVE